MNDNNAGRLSYWRTKADLCQELFEQQVQQGGQIGEAVKNLERFIHAKNMESALLNGVNYSFLQEENK